MLFTKSNFKQKMLLVDSKNSSDSLRFIFFTSTFGWGTINTQKGVGSSKPLFCYRGYSIFQPFKILEIYVDGSLKTNELLYQSHIPLHYDGLPILQYELRYIDVHPGWRLLAPVSAVPAGLFHTGQQLASLKHQVAPAVINGQ